MRDAGSLLLKAFIREAGGTTTHRLTERHIAWASATFTGARHEVTLLLTGADAAARADRLAAEIAELEFRLPGHLVADALFAGRRDTADGIEIDLEALTIEDG